MAERTFNNLGGRIALAGGFQIKGGASFESGAGFPKSGTAGTTVRNGIGAQPGGLYMDTTNDVLFVNEGTAASPYWTPVSFEQRGLLGWYSDFTKGASLEKPLGEAAPNTFVWALGKTLADTQAALTLTDGIRVHGQGIEQTDSGLTVAMSDQGAVGTLTATNEDAHIAVISVGNGTVPVFQPDQNGTMVVDANLAVSSLTASAAFLGFCGSAADALDPIMTYSGTTISFATTIGDDVAGLAYSSEMTDNDRWFAPHDKGNANASIATTATGVDTGVDLVAATYQRLRVECDADGVVRVFIDKALISTFSACLDADEEVHPMVYIESSTTATKAMTLKHFATWGKRA
jgi:hypothetical protein